MLVIKTNWIYKFLLISLLLLLVCSVMAQSKSQAVPVIFDSDMGPDYDDVGAITLLHAFADSGRAKILATVASTKYEGVAAVFDVFNTYFNRPDILIGVPKGKASELKDGQHWTDSVQLNYPHSVTKNAEVPDATEVYRKVLASQPDKSVTIVTTGFLTNLYNLLQSQPDKHSKLDGKKLVKQKVKQLVCMAGGFPSFSEFNVKIDAAASKFVFDNWETPTIFSGFEIGWKIRSGLPLINNTSIKNSPVKDVFRISIPMSQQDSAGRMSWDQTAVLVAIKGYEPWYRLEKGKIVVADDGSNTWAKEPLTQGHLVEAQSHLIVQNFINKLMMHQPMKK
jgi:inosine-uridine nucleoside N-ribohydrolase